MQQHQQPAPPVLPLHAHLPQHPARRSAAAMAEQMEPEEVEIMCHIEKLDSQNGWARGRKNCIHFTDDAVLKRIRLHKGKGCTHERKKRDKQSSCVLCKHTTASYCTICKWWLCETKIVDGMTCFDAWHTVEDLVKERSYRTAESKNR